MFVIKCLALKEQFSKLELAKLINYLFCLLDLLLTII